LTLSLAGILGRGGDRYDGILSVTSLVAGRVGITFNLGRNLPFRACPQVLRQTPGLLADIRDRDNFPKGARGNRPKREDAIRYMPFHINRCAIAGDRQAQPQHIGAHHTAALRIAQQGILSFRNVGSAAAALEDALRVHGLVDPGATPSDPYIDTSAPRDKFDETGGDYTQFPSCAGHVEMAFRIRSDTMAMHIPIWTRMAQKTKPVGGRECLPECLRVGAQSIHDTSVDAGQNP
jgi:hypothetical protein